MKALGRQITKVGKHEVVIIGSGAGGLSVAGQLLNTVPELDVAIVDDRKYHYYQSGWSLAATGMVQVSRTMERTENVIPSNAKLVQERVTRVDGENNRVILEGNQSLEYDSLIVAPGLTLNWDQIKGLPEYMGKDGVCSNHDWYNGLDEAIRCYRYLEKGKVLFNRPSSRIKAPGAAYSALFLFEDMRRIDGIRNRFDVHWYTGLPTLWAAEKYDAALDYECRSRGIDTHLNHELVAVDGDNKVATFQVGQEQVHESFDMLHVVPPMKVPKGMELLLNQEGYVNVCPHTLRHRIYTNVYGIGDAIGTENNRGTGAASAQAPVVAQNVIDTLSGNEPSVIYNGYTSTPIFTHVGKVMRVETEYGGKPREILGMVMDQSFPSRIFYMYEKYISPHVYQHGVLKGRWSAFNRPTPKKSLD